MNDTQWTKTRHGGYRRTRIAQLVERHSDEVKDGSAQRPGFIAGRKSKPVKGRSVDSAGSSTTVAGGDRGTGFKSPSAYRKKFIVKMNEKLGLPSCPYVVRWRVETPWFSVRLHHWLAPDDDRAKHDHPWDFVTFVLRGGYTDASPDGDEHLRAPAVRYRAATHQHTVFPDPGGAWTVIVTGPKIRQWGFWVNGKFVKMNKYFLSHGHHPCN